MAGRRRGRRGKRTGLLDYWQNIMDATKDFVDGRIDRLRDDDEDVVDDIDDLKQAVAELDAKLDRMAEPRK